MKRIFSVFKNIGYMTRLSAKFAPLQYFIAILEMVWNVAMPFIDLLFPKWILDELTGEKRWEKVLAYMILWAILNGGLLLLKTLEGFFVSLYENHCSVKESIHYGKMDSEMDYERLENGAVSDERNRIKSNVSLSYFAYDTWANIAATFILLAGYTYIIATLHPLMVVFILIVIFCSSMLSKKRLEIQYAYQSKITRFQRRFGYLFSTLIGYAYAKEVRINRAANWLTKKYTAETKSYIGVFAEKQKRDFKTDTIADLIMFAQTIVLYVYSTYCVLIGAITIGSFSMYIGSISAFTGTFSKMIHLIQQLKFTSDYIDSYKDYVEKSIPTHSKKGVNDVDFAADRHDIEFCNVSSSIRDVTIMC